MLTIRKVFIILAMLLCSSAIAEAQLSIGIRLPNVNIGINVPVYPNLVIVPGYPVYYAPDLDANFFFYDGLYWIYQDDNWYSSYWYNGPWWLEDPEFVPVFILRIPVRYYRRPPRYFRNWLVEAPPRWEERWGREWEHRHSGWNNWDRKTAPVPAPLPLYQRQYSGERYPRKVEQQHELNIRNYRYQSRDPLVRQHIQERTGQKSPVQQGKTPQRNDSVPQQDRSRQEGALPAKPVPQLAPNAPHPLTPKRGDDSLQRSPPSLPQQRRLDVQEHRQAPRQELGQRNKPAREFQDREKRQQGQEFKREPKRKQEQEKEKEQRSERKRDRNE